MQILYSENVSTCQCPLPLCDPQQRWAGSCAGARNAASSLETELKTQATAIRAQAADEMAALQKVFAKEVDRILGL